jgi:NAD(P)-dependent dehydrogenase (short-subunit alcohol dehydrogenase family)
MAAKSTISLRTVVGSAGIGLAAAAAPSFAKGNSEMAPQELQNPAYKYPKPPYKQQSRGGQPAELGSIYVQLAAANASYATGHVCGSAGGSGQP